MVRGGGGGGPGEAAGGVGGGGGGGDFGVGDRDDLPPMRVGVQRMHRHLVLLHRGAVEGG